MKITGDNESLQSLDIIIKSIEKYMNILEFSFALKKYNKNK